MTRYYDDRLAAHGLTITQFALLRNIARAGEIQLNHLANHLVMDRTSLYRTIAPVAQAGWVEIDPVDGRTKVARLTPAGRTLMTQADADWEFAQTNLLNGIDEQEWQALERTLGRLIEIAQA